MFIQIAKFLLKPWVMVASSGDTAVYLLKQEKTKKERLREAKLELVEQQRTIDRLRAELGRERHLRQEAEKSIDSEQKEEALGDEA